MPQAHASSPRSLFGGTSVLESSTKWASSAIWHVSRVRDRAAWSIFCWVDLHQSTVAYISRRQTVRWLSNYTIWEQIFEWSNSDETRQLKLDQEANKDDKWSPTCPQQTSQTGTRWWLSWRYTKLEPKQLGLLPGWIVSDRLRLELKEM